MNLLFKISYGLYILSARENERDNACVINTLMQQTSSPERVSITVNKANLTCEMIERTDKAIVSILSENTLFKTIQGFGMRSGRTCEKFLDIPSERGENGILAPLDGSIGYLELAVIDKIDFGSHIEFLCEVTRKRELMDFTPLTYSHYQNHIKPRPNTEIGEAYVCSVCGYIHKGVLPKDFICPTCKHGSGDFVKMESNAETKGEDNKKINLEGDKKMAKFVCMVCGYVHEGDAAPEKCPICKAPASKFQKQSEDLNWAAEHVVGIAEGVSEDIIKDLRGNFNGECSEVGMYLAMSRAAFREGYPEVGLYYEKAAYEEAEHAAKFAELLGEVVSSSTKINLQKRVEAENGATLGKFDLAKRAKEQGLDAIHDTVHEMARDEARHGKAFLGLLNRYFGK